MRFFVGVVTLAACLAQAALASAQQITTGTITGVVKDEQSLVLPAATVELVNEQTADVRQALSNQTGSFTIAAVTQGRYTLKVNLDGFRPLEQRGIQLRSGETFNAGSLTLSVGQISETTTVIADLAVIQTASAERSSVLEAQQLDALIVRGRDPMSLVNLLPGVTPVTNVASLGGQIGPTTPTIAGQIGNSAGIALDGMASSDGDTGNNNSPMSVDAIEEMVVLLNNYQAEYGRNTGAQINVISKSGTQNYRGTLATYVRHEALNANQFFNNRTGLPKPLYQYKTLTGTLGGPVPGFARDKLFFFYVREMWDAQEPRASRTSTMPTALERQGDFSQTLDLNGRLITIRDPLTGQPFPGNRIPANRIDGLGQSLLNIFPQPNFFDQSVSGGNFNYREQGIADQTKTLDQIKLDLNATTADRFSVRVRRWRPVTEAHSGVFAVNSNWDHFRHGYTQRENSVQVNHTHTFGTAIVNEASVTYRYTQEVGPTLDTLDPVTRAAMGLGALGQLYPNVNQSTIVPAATFAGVPSPPTLAFDGRFPIDGGDNRWTFANTVSWAKTRHLIKAGLYYEHNKGSEGPGPIQNCFSGCFNFASTDPNNPLNSGHAFANALLGTFTSYQEASARPLSAGTAQFVEWFLQDSWKPRSNLTLELGIRFAWGQPWRLLDGRPGASWVADRFDRSRQARLYRPVVIDGQRRGYDAVTGRVVSAALIGALVPGSGDFTSGIVTQDDPLAMGGAWRETPSIQPQPRIGFSWDPKGDASMAIRGGYGLTKQVLQDSGDFNFRLPAAPPVRLQPTLFYGSINALDASQGQFFPENVPVYQADYTPMTTHNFSIEVQRNIGFQTVVSVAYVGNRQRNLARTRNLNVVPEGARFNAANVDPTTGRALPDNFLRPMVGLGDVSRIENTGIADYDSLQVTGQRRFAAGFSYGGTYTLSRTMAIDAATGGNVPAGALGTPILPLYRDDRAWLYDYANADRRHLASLNFSWDLPKASGKWNNLLARVVLDDWQLAGVALLASGPPSGISFTTTDNADILGGGDGNRVVVTCDPTLPGGERSFNRWFNTSCFARPAVGEVGHDKRQMIRLPGSRNVDFTLSKNVPLGASHRRLQFRAEFYNAFNITNWTAVDTAARFDALGNQINPTFGQVTAAGDPRVIQLSLRFAF